MEKKTDQLTDRIRFINADCMDIMAQYPDKYFDLAIVDPPYGLGIDGQKESIVLDYSTSNHRSKSSRKLHKAKGWDNSCPQIEYFNELYRISSNQIIWGANYFPDRITASKGWIVWYKGQNGLTMSDCELAWTSFNTPTRQKELNRIALQIEGTIHPTQKPVKLYEWIYHNYAKPEFKILDTHLGSGSNAIAAHNYGIAEFVGIELDPEYYADSIKRFNRVTAQLRMF